MAAANPSSRPHAVSGPAPFSPSEALTAIKLLLPRLDNWHICDGAPQEFCGWIAINQRNAQTFGDSIRGLHTSVPKSSPFSDVYKLVADQACHGEPPEKSSNVTTATSPTALIKQPESLVGRGETLQMLKDFSDRLEPRRDEEDWKHLVAMFDRLLKLPAYDGIGPSGKSPSYVSTSVWLIVGRNIHSLDSRLLNDLEGAAVALVQSAAKSSRLPSGEALAGGEKVEAEFVFCLNGDGYFLKGFGVSGHVTAKGTKGLHDLYRLIQSPDVPVTMLELDAGPGVERAEGDGRSRQPVADVEALKQIAAKRKELKADIASAGSDMERSELEAELGTLEESAKGMTGLNGKSRDMNDPFSKLRPRLLKRISAARAKLREAKLDKLADHFGLAVTSESGWLVYRPAVEGLTWNVTNL